MPSIKHSTNIEAVTKMMNFSAYGALAQSFIMDAIAKQAEHIAGMSIEELKAHFGENSLVRAEAWHGVATEIKEKFDQHFRS